MKNQTQMIKEHLESGKTLTPLEALNKFGCLRLGARIWDLRNDGLHILTDSFKTPSGKIVAKYRIVKNNL